MSFEPVRFWRDAITLPTYEPFPPQKAPMFLEKRVYQGSSGRVYPLPVTDRISETPVSRAWDAVYLENEYLQVMVLPEIGGRVHAIRDKTNGYELVYRQDVVKPALVGLAGPWLSGGIEFNWPQHHRPSTFLPCDVEIEEHPDGARTVWLSEHDPMQRMKGMHGVCLHPGRAMLELKVRAYNRTPFVQTFLWWANVATRAHEAYQSFFPPDVTYVADHAKRSMSTYPQASGRYYGVEYGERAQRGVPPAERPRKYLPRHEVAEPPRYGPDDLSWYANIPVPTSYMCMGSGEDFFGGYDHKAQAGIVHVANRHISPGKKQWTWGNQEFGYAWDRNLTEPDASGEVAPYIELMAGVYTDNQPDFAFLQPGETKTWSQFWLPIREIGPAQKANVEGAVSLSVEGRKMRLGVAVTRARPNATVRVSVGGTVRLEEVVDLAPERPWKAERVLRSGVNPTDVRVAVIASDGVLLVEYQPRERSKAEVPPPATEPPPPEEIASVDELFITGLHLEQYRHATRRPEECWREALRRDPGDARCNHALGAWHLRRGEFEVAERHLRTAIERLTRRNPNPYDGEPYYTLGLCLRFVGRDDEAYDAFYKATWNLAWQAAGFHALAEIDCVRRDWDTARQHLERVLRVNADNLRARDLQAMVLRRLGQEQEAEVVLAETLALDPLDWWARHLRGDELRCDTQTRLDLVHDHVRAGFWREALELLEGAQAEEYSGAAPLVGYTAAWVCTRMGEERAARAWRGKAREVALDYCFPARLEEIGILQWTAERDVRDGRAAYLLGNWLYDRRRHGEAIVEWERAVRREPGNAIAWRNLGLAYFNVRGDAVKARGAYERAFRRDADARLLFERDQLWKRIGVGAEERVKELERHAELVRQRDDLSVELGALLLQVGREEEALALMTGRKFQPWEGGEGLSRGVFVRAHVALGRAAFRSGDAVKARGHFEAALTSPENLGEARHMLANPGDVYFWLGCAHEAAGERASARAAWKLAGELKGDFQEKHVTAFSEKTYFTALAWRKLGRAKEAAKLLRELLAYARALPKQQAKIDYFATSLPTMILFEDDLQARRVTAAKFLEGLALRGLGRSAEARRAMREVLRRDPSFPSLECRMATV